MPKSIDQIAADEGIAIKNSLKVRKPRRQRLTRKRRPPKIPKLSGPKHSSKYKSPLSKELEEYLLASIQVDGE